MARKRKRSWKAPMVLWQIFKNDARNLAKTIAFIIPRPSPPFTCGRCEGRFCLRCCEDPMSFLIRPDDPLDYVNLLNDCFVVVNEDAPFIDFYPDKRWTQEKHTNSSHIVELLTSSAWGILHERVGDKCMFHLLWHTTIFVPISDKKHLQVAGSPVNYFRKKSKEVKNPQSGMQYYVASTSHWYEDMALQRPFKYGEKTCKTNQHTFFGHLSMSNTHIKVLSIIDDWLK
ncbi:hypothetical protein ES319_A05G416000v1 [Gossypium barbadense]|uniref:Telomerase reverse transcriptase n=1 Tax=Gossypium barbadense TaxID=3634 RepID=A0A5J5W156_GOSBA|nr:hypothetical protein ES319_A05G416000v1 [Gossypium barbadense]